MAPTISENAILDAVWKLVTRRVSERTSATVDLVGDVLHGLGPIHRKEQELLAGDRVLNQDRQILPRIARATGLGVCLYLGNRRVAAVSVLEAGDAPDPGGYADALVVEAVLRKRETFRGAVERGGRTHVVACRPLFATDKPDDYGPLGMIEAFTDEASTRETVATALRESLGSEIKPRDAHHADQIERVMGFIDDVARRLQLLALNGNIIAAQAGDHGRAFRVVCRELSSLAEQSKDNVSEIRKLRALMDEAGAEMIAPDRPLEVGDRGPPDAARVTGETPDGEVAPATEVAD